MRVRPRSVGSRSRDAAHNRHRARFALQDFDVVQVAHARPQAQIQRRWRRACPMRRSAEAVPKPCRRTSHANDGDERLQPPSRATVRKAARNRSLRRCQARPAETERAALHRHASRLRSYPAAMRRQADAAAISSRQFQRRNVWVSLGSAASPTGIPHAKDWRARSKRIARNLKSKSNSKSNLS